MIIKIFGERNTGTNYLEKLIKLNFPQFCLLEGTSPKFVRAFSYLFKDRLSNQIIDFYFSKTKMQNLGWKHACPIEFILYESFASKKKQKILFVCLVKNPYSFLLSLYKKPYHILSSHKSFSEFIRTTYSPHKRENINEEQIKIVDLWNIKIQAYKELKMDIRFDAVFIKYEDLLVNINGPLSALAKKSASIKTANFKNFTKPAKKDNIKSFDYFKEYYMTEKWKEKFSTEDIDFINSNINIEYMNELKYEIL